jgi:hypothetical protein
MTRPQYRLLSTFHASVARITSRNTLFVPNTLSFQNQVRKMAVTSSVLSEEARFQMAETPAQIPVLSHKKLHGRAFYESIGSPTVVLAPMVDQSEFVGHQCV